MGTANPEGCQCKLPHETICTQRFSGMPVRVSIPSRLRPGHANSLDGFEAEVTAKVSKRVDLFHFIRGLQFHLRCAEETLAKMDSAAAAAADTQWSWELGDKDV